MAELDRSTIPRLYGILDAEAVERRGLDLFGAAEALRAAGVLLLQYRDKRAKPAEVLVRARGIGQIFAGSESLLLLNDWPELAGEAGWHGVHVGQGDAAAELARATLGAGAVIGISTHTDDQVRAADRSCADYIAIGPVFGTQSKESPEVAVGLHGVERARLLTNRPLVAIGGITAMSAATVRRAGADSVAVIAALLDRERSIQENVAALLQASR